MSCVEGDWRQKRAAGVEVIMPDPHFGEDGDATGGGGAATATASSAAGSTGAAATASLTAPDCSSLAEKAIAALPPDLAAQAIDPKRKARSQDPGWKFGWWPDPSKKVCAMYFLSEGSPCRNKAVQAAPCWGIW